MLSETAWSTARRNWATILWLVPGAGLRNCYVHKLDLSSWRSCSLVQMLFCALISCLARSIKPAFTEDINILAYQWPFRCLSLLKHINWETLTFASKAIKITYVSLTEICWFFIIPDALFFTVLLEQGLTNLFPRNVFFLSIFISYNFYSSCFWGIRLSDKKTGTIFPLRLVFPGWHRC